MFGVRAQAHACGGASQLQCITWVQLLCAQNAPPLMLTQQAAGKQVYTLLSAVIRCTLYTHAH